MNDYPPAFRPADAIVLFVMVTGSLLCWYSLTVKEQRARTVVITNGMGQKMNYTLNGPKKLVKANGPLGTTLLEVSQSGVRFVTSPCPNNLCINMGLFNKSGQSGACVPNRIIVHLEGKSSLDGVTQ